MFLYEQEIIRHARYTTITVRTNLQIPTAKLQDRTIRDTIVPVLARSTY
jgi:hypothetical protein